MAAMHTAPALPDQNIPSIGLKSLGPRLTNLQCYNWAEIALLAVPN